MTGFDVEGGYRVLDWADGSLYAYVNPYLLSATGTGTFIGLRGRLLAEFNDRYTAGFAVSSDGRFGTNVVFQVGVSLGKSRSRQGDETPSESVLSRLAQPVQRQDTMAIDRQATGFQAALNPATGEAWFFAHVTDGATGGDGTFENPFGEGTDAATIVPTDGNGVIYVDSGDRSGMDGFMLPANVQALSTGVSQFLDVSTNVDDLSNDAFTFQLPGSGTGTLPLINGATITVNGRTGMVGMNNNSTLSGFEIQANVNGVVAANVTGVTIDRNQITTTDQDAIYLDADNGTFSNATISSNTLTTSGNGDDGVTVRATNSGVMSNVTISGNTISTSGNATANIFLAAVNNGVISNVTISGNTLSASGTTNAPPIYSRSAAGTTSNVTISGNTISTSGGSSDGIRIRANNGASSSNIRIFDNVIRQAGRHSVFIRTNANTANVICIAQFTGNTSSLPNVAAGGGNDLNFTIGGGTVSFVNFANITSNNNGFDDISGTPTATPTSC